MTKGGSSEGKEDGTVINMIHEGDLTSATSKRPAANMNDRKSRIPLDVQVMMATGPSTAEEIIYYPWVEQGGVREAQAHDQKVAENEGVMGRKESTGQEEKIQEQAGVAKV
nr:unnamed protein product [Haemonchus contortus]